MAQVPSVTKDSEATSTPEFSILNCPICLEHFRQPKSLPCLHTFCQECLSTFITATTTKGSTSHPTFFSCPVCRRSIQPLEPSSNPNVWSGHFPTNNFVVELLKKENPHESRKQVCRPCEKRKKETSASSWCKNCGFFMCESCKTSHDVVLDDHDQFTMDELLKCPTVFVQQHPRCEKHHKKSDLLCVDHESVGCHKCMAVEHRKCDNVTSVTEYTENLKSGDRLHKINVNLDTRVKDLDVLIQNSRSKLDLITKDRDTALQSLSEWQTLLNKMISELQDDVMKIYKKEEENIRGNLEALEILRSSLLQTKSMSTTFLEIGNENQLLSTVLRGNSEMKVSDDIVKERTVKNQRVRFFLELDKDVLNLKTNNKIGTIVIKNERDSPLETSQKPSMFGRKAEHLGTITVPLPRDSSSYRITGMIALPNNNIIMADFKNNRVVYITETSQVIDEIKVDGQPWTLCSMPDGNYAVSLHNSNMIILMQLSPLRCIRQIQLTQTPFGVTYFKGSLYTTFAYENERPLCKISAEDQRTQVLEFDTYNYYITYRQLDASLVGTLYHSDPSKTAVYSVSPDHVMSEVVRADVVKGTWGIDTDDEDNVYVCGRNSNNVVQISADCSMTRELLTSTDIQTPEAVSVCGNKVYVSQCNKQDVKIYRLV